MGQRRRASIYTPKLVWSDGIHFVRPASAKDRHKMRWVVSAHTVTGSRLSRHAPTLEDGIDICRRATKAWLKANPADKQHFSESTEPQASASAIAQRSGEDGRRRGEDGRSCSEMENSAIPKVTLATFSTTHFNCIVANPVAQVWQCVTREGERKSPGRRRVSGEKAQPTAVFHEVGECAVLIGDEPQREPDGSVTIFPNWSQAAERAQELYETADEEDRLLWKEGDMKVYSTMSVDVIFDPQTNGAAKPFSLYLPEYRRPVYEDRTRPVMASQGPKIDPAINPQAALALKEQRRKDRERNRVPSFEERPLRFRSIVGAIVEADRRERMLKGEIVV